VILSHACVADLSVAFGAEELALLYRVARTLLRLGVIWVVYRGDAHAVTFEPRKIPVTDGKASTTVRFSAPGTYVLRAYADDGMLVASKDVTVTVK